VPTNRHSENDAAAAAADALVARGYVSDPTRNVLDLVTAAIKRQDDLRFADSGNLREIVGLRADYDDKLRDAETARIDAIRSVDVGNVQRAAEVQAAQALTLATQVTTSADALRAQVEAARQQTATALAAALEPIQKDIQDLRRVQYEGVGQRIQSTEEITKSGASSQVAMAIASALAILISLGTLITLLVKG
jgi:hypothetical protein